MLPWSIMPLVPPHQNPKIGRATRAQIVAVLPAALQINEGPDPQGEKRYARLLAVARRVSALGASPSPAKLEPLLRETEGILSGSLRIPVRPDPIESFPHSAQIKAFAKALAKATVEAAERGDRIACARNAVLGLRLGDRLVAAGGTTINLMVSAACEAISERAVFEADAKGGFDAAGRQRILGLLKPLKGSMPEMAAAMRRDCYAERLPLLIDPFAWEESHAPTGGKKPSTMPGNYDPIATARLVGKIYATAIADVQRPFGTQTGEADRLSKAAGRGIPDPGQWSRNAKFMNATPNSIGRFLAGIGAPPSFALVGARRATTRNLVRLAILQHAGRSEALPDGFGGGTLKSDAKRRIIWSVGSNRKDDGGQIGKGWNSRALDFGIRF